MISLDIFCGLVLGYFFDKQTGSSAAKLRSVIYERRPDILILGNSRAYHHYDSKLIEDSLKMTCFNAGLDGGHSIFLSEAILALALDRYSPKMIVLDFNPGALLKNEGDYDKLSILLPYYGLDKRVDEIILLRNQFERLKLISRIYPYNSEIYNLLRFNFLLIDEDSEFAKYGFSPITKPALSKVQLEKSMENTYDETYSNKIDTNKLVSFRNIMNICRKKDIILVLSNSPSLLPRDRYSYGSMVLKVIPQIYKSSNCIFLDYASESESVFKKYFVDLRHLNNSGSKIFTRELIKDLSHQFR